MNFQQKIPLNYSISGSCSNNGASITFSSQNNEAYKDGHFYDHATCTVSVNSVHHDFPKFDIDQLKMDCVEMSTSSIFKMFYKNGLMYGKNFKLLSMAYANNNMAIVLINNSLFSKSMFLHPAVLDGCFQAMLVPVCITGLPRPYIPYKIGEIIYFDVKHVDLLYAVAYVLEYSDAFLKCNCFICDKEGNVMVAVLGFLGKSKASLFVDQKNTNMGSDDGTGTHFGVKWKKINYVQHTYDCNEDMLVISDSTTPLESKQQLPMTWKHAMQALPSLSSLPQLVVAYLPNINSTDGFKDVINLLKILQKESVLLIAHDAFRIFPSDVSVSPFQTAIVGLVRSLCMEDDSRQVKLVDATDALSCMQILFALSLTDIVTAVRKNIF